MHEAEAAQSEDPQGLSTALWTVVVDVPWVPAHATQAFRRQVEADAQALFGADVDVLRTTPTPGLERWTITGRLPDAAPDRQRRRLQSHYADGFGRRAVVQVEGAI